MNPAFGFTDRKHAMGIAGPAFAGLRQLRASLLCKRKQLFTSEQFIRHLPEIGVMRIRHERPSFQWTSKRHLHAELMVTIRSTGRHDLPHSFDNLGVHGRQLSVNVSVTILLCCGLGQRKAGVLRPIQETVDNLIAPLSCRNGSDRFKDLGANWDIAGLVHHAFRPDIVDTNRHQREWTAKGKKACVRLDGLRGTEPNSPAIQVREEGNIPPRVTKKHSDNPCDSDGLLQLTSVVGSGRVAQVAQLPAQHGFVVSAHTQPFHIYSRLVGLVVRKYAAIPKAVLTARKVRSADHRGRA